MLVPCDIGTPRSLAKTRLHTLHFTNPFLFTSYILSPPLLQVALSTLSAKNREINDIYLFNEVQKLIV